MVERDMEDLISEYTDDFFPRKGLRLKGRQKSFAGVGRFDLLFEDQFDTNILMELKAVPARYEDANQLARYKEELERRDEKNVLMWLVAPQIPNSVREFLDRIGIEYSEIHVAEFKHVAQRHGVAIRSEVEQPVASAAAASVGMPNENLLACRSSASSSAVEVGPVVTTRSTLRWRAYGYDLALMNPEAFNAIEFNRLIDTFEEAVPSRRNSSLVQALRTWTANPQHVRLAHAAYSSLLRWVTTSGWKAAVPHAEAIWAYLFGLPVPSWYVWNQAMKKYHFDGNGWRTWYVTVSDKS